MDESTAIDGLSALAQESRLAAFRLLVKAGGEGLAAGALARALAIPHNTMSAHLSVLAKAGLIQARRKGRSIIYSINRTAIRDLFDFLLQDCCQGRPELCAPRPDSPERTGAAAAELAKA